MWSFDDLLAANDVLDLYEDMQARELEKIERNGRRT